MSSKLIFINSEKSIEELITAEKITLTQAQHAASMCFKRRDRFVEGYYHEKELLSLLKKYFGDIKQLIKTKLVYQFNNLKKEITEKNLIGLILTGVNINTPIQKYTQTNFKMINLTISSITRTILKEYFTENEINALCISTPNFHIYYIKEDEEFKKLDSQETKRAS